MEQVPRGEMLQRQVVSLGKRELVVTLTDGTPNLALLIPLRINCYLRPHADRLLAGIESAFGVPLPDQLDVAFQGSREPVKSPAEWHLYLHHGDRFGIQTAERILVQIAARATRGGAPDSGGISKLHSVVCPLIEEQVDITYICALEML